jgi:hypothetical protein
MDYCDPCRRHLNGALACPGCGAPARTSHPYAPQGAATPYEAYDGAVDHHARGDGGESSADDTDAAADADADYVDYADDEAESGAHGRAAARRRGGDDEGPAGTAASRRDRKAAAHRRRRRRTLLVAVGFVLAAGGLSLAELGIDAPGFSNPNPATAGGEAPDGGASTAGPAPTARPLDEASRGGTSAPTRGASSSPSASESPKDKASHSPDDGGPAKAQQSAQTGPAGTPTAPASPATSGPTATPTAAPTTSGPTPQPSPSQTCKRFLWWCS